MNTQFFFGTEFRRRLTTALVGVPLVLLSVLIGKPVWDLLVVGVSFVCVLELQRMISPGSRTGVVGMLAITLACFISYNYPFILPLTLLVFFAAQFVRSFTLDGSKRQILLRHFLYASIGALYIGLPLSLLLAVRGMDRGWEWTGIAFANNWATDGFALIGGRIAGHTKLAPRISPGKTVEGALIGLVVGFIFGMGFSLLVGLSVGKAVVANVAIAILTEAGDLLESWIKRFFAVKDAGDILPGHGGLLDRVDGMLLAGPALYLMLRLL